MRLLATHLCSTTSPFVSRHFCLVPIFVSGRHRSPWSSNDSDCPIRLRRHHETRRYIRGIMSDARVIHDGDNQRIHETAFLSTSVVAAVAPTRVTTMSSSSSSSSPISPVSLPIPPPSHDWRDYAHSRPDRYALMPEPARASTNAHILTGPLRHDHPQRLVVYDVFRVRRHTADADPDVGHDSSPTSSSSYDSASDLNPTLLVGAAIHVGTEGLDGHIGFIHGGILALLLDDVCGYAYATLTRHDHERSDDNNDNHDRHGRGDRPSTSAHGIVPLAVTANLNVNYRRRVPSGSGLVLRVYLREWRDRKITLRATLSPDSTSAHLDLDQDNEHYCHATGIFVIPREVYGQVVGHVATEPLGNSS